MSSSKYVREIFLTHIYTFSDEITNYFLLLQNSKTVSQYRLNLKIIRKREAGLLRILHFWSRAKITISGFPLELVIAPDEKSSIVKEDPLGINWFDYEEVLNITSNLATLYDSEIRAVAENNELLDVENFYFRRLFVESVDNVYREARILYSEMKDSKRPILANRYNFLVRVKIAYENGMRLVAVDNPEYREKIMERILNREKRESFKRKKEMQMDETFSRIQQQPRLEEYVDTEDSYSPTLFTTDVNQYAQSPLIQSDLDETSQSTENLYSFNFSELKKIRRAMKM